jgi:hypothetical protein
MSRCESTRRFTGSEHVFHCGREDGHYGSHQSISKGYYKDPAILSNARWNEEGAVSSAVPKMLWNECDECFLLIEDEKALCFGCEHWLGIIVEGNPDRIIINQGHYLVGSKGGFGGREFSIEFFDSSRQPMTTDRLWSQGKIPAQFGDRLPDNAQWKKSNTKEPSSAVADLQNLLNP